ncbi:MAG: hypothetical protein WCD23_08815 [Candidatus Acidiferrales bacterium]
MPIIREWLRKALLISTPCAFCVAALLSVGASRAAAQADIPIISGGVGFLSETNAGATFMQPVIAPVLTVPLGDRWLVEARADLRGFVARQDGTTGPYQGQFFDTLEYLQVDYNAASWLTLTAGRFLTPFDIFNERLSAVWIDKFQDAPIIVPIGTAQGYSDGFMARGALISRPGYVVNYTTYFSTLSNINKFESERSTGFRGGVFFPHARLELGASYQRLLQSPRANSEGVYWSWQPYEAPLDLKGEWAHSPGGQGYWIQSAYRLSHFGGSHSAVGRIEPVFRMQQFVRSMQVLGDFLPALDTQRADFGLNYYLPHEVRLNASYSRRFTPGDDANIWAFGITYRFLLPLWPGESK